MLAAGLLPPMAIPWPRGLAQTPAGPVHVPRELPMVATLPACAIWIPQPGMGTTQCGSAEAHPPPQSLGCPLNSTQPVDGSPTAEMAPVEEPTVAPPPCRDVSLKTVGAEDPDQG